jgi:hypothetical protein
MDFGFWLTTSSELTNYSFPHDFPGFHLTFLIS